VIRLFLVKKFKMLHYILGVTSLPSSKIVSSPMFPVVLVTILFFGCCLIWLVILVLF
jgi:hypothetical protein